LVDHTQQAVTQRLDALQRQLGHRFHDPQLLQRALSHRSAGPDHNERLEFLGDAVLATAVADLLYRRFGDSDEGDLTRIRAHLVRENSLYHAALVLQLPDLLRLSSGEARSGGAQRASMLADALEALIGAVFVDAGFDAAARVVQVLFGDTIDHTQVDTFAKDAKTALQEWLQSRRQAVPSYRIVAATGQAHAQSFEVACSVVGLPAPLHGHGRSRRAAEQAAASLALAALQALSAPVSSPSTTPASRKT
jgi:ribonuclease III